MQNDGNNTPENPENVSEIQNELDTQSPTTVPPPLVPAKKSKKRLIIILVIAFIVLAAAGFAGFLLLTQKSSPTTNTAQTSENDPTIKQDDSKLTAKALVALAKAMAKGETKETLQSTDNKPYNVFRAPAFRPSGYDFSVGPSIDYGFGSYGTKATVTTDLASIQKVLVDNKLTGTVLDPGSDEGMFAAQYESDDIVCIVTDQKPYQQPATSTEFNTIIGCADKSAYLAAAVELKPYFVVYAAQSPYDTTKTAMGGLATTQSKTTGYTTSQVSISGSEYGSVGGFAGLFYTTPDKVLHYFTGTQSVLLCEQYNTDDLRKAYLGEKCYIDSDQLSTVKL